MLPFCSLPQFPFHHPCTGLITPSVGNITGSRDGGAGSCPGGCKVPPVSLVPPAGLGRVAQQPGKTLCSHSELKTRAAAASCPGLGAHPHPRAACPRLWAGFWGHRQAQEGPAAGLCCCLLPIPAPSRRGREREGKDVSNQSYLNKSLFGPRALLKAAYLIKSPIFHIYGPYSVKY